MCKPLASKYILCEDVDDSCPCIEMREDNTCVYEVEFLGDEIDLVLCCHPDAGKEEKNENN